MADAQNLQGATPNTPANTPLNAPSTPIDTKKMLGYGVILLVIFLGYKAFNKAS